MKKTTNLLLGISLLATAAATSAPASAEEVKTEAPKNSLLSADSYTPIWGEAMTLPARVLRFRTPVAFVNGSKGFTSTGKAQDSGFDVNVLATYVVLEYGLTDAISVQALMPRVMSSEMTIDAARFKGSEVYKKKLAEYAALAARKAVDQGLTTYDYDTVYAAIVKGTDPTITIGAGGLDVPLSTGENKHFAPGAIKVSDEINKLLVNAATPQAGKTGWGDLEVGALFNLVNPNVGLLKDVSWAQNWPVNFSVGTGFRIPTGQYKDVSGAYRGTSRGTLDFAIRSNFDYMVRKGLAISWQNQFEVMVKKGTKGVSSLLDPTRMVTSSDITAAGYDASTYSYERDFVRRGARNLGFLQVGYGFGDIDPNYNFLSTTLRYNYEFGPAVYLGNDVYSDQYTQEGVTASLSVDGLAMKVRVPVQFTSEYYMPVSGQAVSLATNQWINSLKLFWRF